MSISFQKAFGLYEGAINLRAQRAQVLANNLANADTPNFKAQDFDVHAALRSSGGRADVARQSADLQFRMPNQPSIDGNTVDEHQEHAQFMENTLEYQVAFTLLNGRVKGLQKAIRGD